MVRAHSTVGAGLRPGARLRRSLLLAAIAAAPIVLVASPAAALPAGETPASVHWMRLERRIESGYFQQNAATLRSLAATLAVAGTPAAGAGGGDDGNGTWRSYYGALAAYRLALLAKSDVARAWPYTEQCSERLDRVLAADNDSAEALALQSACLALQSRLDPWRSPLAAPLSRSRAERALRLAPDNPRVLLLGALAAGDRPRLFGGDPQRASVLLGRAVSAFERQRGRPRTVPGWGAADAFTYMARDDLARGQPLAARDVLERALLVAPDFAQARLLMAEIVSG
jgi:hypothetical protein